MRLELILQSLQSCFCKFSCEFGRPEFLVLESSIVRNAQADHNNRDVYLEDVLDGISKKKIFE